MISFFFFTDWEKLQATWSNKREKEQRIRDKETKHDRKIFTRRNENTETQTSYKEDIATTKKYNQQKTTTAKTYTYTWRLKLQDKK